MPSLRKLRLISKTRSTPPTVSRFRYSSGAMRRKSVMSSVLWCVTNGRASAPPASGCIIGVSTSRNPRASRNRRIPATTLARTSNTRRESGLTMRSRYRWRYRISTSCSPCHFSGRGWRHFARNVIPDAQTVSSFVLVRNTRPWTPTKSPKSSSLNTAKSRSGTLSCRMYAWMRFTPSESTRKLAFPKVRTARIRPAVVASGRSASRSAAGRSPCAATSALMVSVRTNVRGYVSTPSRSSSARFARRC